MNKPELQSIQDKICNQLYERKWKLHNSYKIGQFQT